MSEKYLSGVSKFFVCTALSISLLSSGAALAAAKKPKQPADAANADAAPQPDKKFPTKASYELKSINGKPIAGNLMVTFSLDESFRATGSAGCNNWSATIYPSNGQRLAVGPIALTRKACDKDAMQMEKLYTSFLHSSPFWDVDGSNMTLKLPNMVMVLQRSL